MSVWPVSAVVACSAGLVCLRAPVMEIVWLEQMMKCPRSLTQFGQLRVARVLRVIAKEQWDPHAP